jgi:hypothetical protein
MACVQWYIPPEDEFKIECIIHTRGFTFEIFLGVISGCS